MFVGQFECFESIQKAELHAAIFFSLQVSAARRVINCFLLIQEYCWLSKWEGEKKSQLSSNQGKMPLLPFCTLKESHAGST